MPNAGPSLPLVIGCLCVAPLLAVMTVILLVWLAQRSRKNLSGDAIVVCAGCEREIAREAAACPQCGLPNKLVSSNDLERRKPSS